VRSGTGIPLPLELMLVIAFNGAIALFLTAIGFGGSLATNAVASQCIGLSIYGMMVVATMLLRQPVTRNVAASAVAIVVGALIGVGVARLVTPRVVDADAFWNSDVLVQSLVIALMFGSIATLLFLMRRRLVDTRDALQQFRLRQLIADRERANLELRVLRAQVEPHFLFNTLANVESLLGTDPERGRHMLHRLTDYLRSSLHHSRREHAPLALELEVVRAFLDIMALRLGARLRWSIHVEPALEVMPMPPMLLQPLVENAVRHGIEPAVDGGTVTVRAERDGTHARISVRDDGVGLSHVSGSSGTGLDNVRERLSAVYGSDARLVIEDLPEGGVCATIWLPLAPSASVDAA
jgi:sensor histidine kinase YesM